MELIPAIDIINGKCVRLTKGDYNHKTVYSDNPADIARRFEELGYRRLHVVDLDGAKSQHIVNTDTLPAIPAASICDSASVYGRMPSAACCALRSFAEATSFIAEVIFSVLRTDAM